ncbi:hypothetical protein [Spirosoma sp.]|uniref:hypothetical protein n=1 Tax=Spirosoma sp. TaxID=1899569 RepID=UPI003B3B6032
MNQQTLLIKNDQARRRFRQDCHLISNSIARLHDRNQRLSNRLVAIIDKQTRLLNRLKNMTAR